MYLLLTMPINIMVVLLAKLRILSTKLSRLRYPPISINHWPFARPVTRLISIAVLLPLVLLYVLVLCSNSSQRPNVTRPQHQALICGPSRDSDLWLGLWCAAHLPRSKLPLKIFRREEDVARSESGELSKDGHRPSMIWPSLSVICLGT